MSLSDLTIHDDVDNTGNVTIWPSEEVAAFYIINHCQEEIHKCKRLIELGAGMSGLAGLLIAAEFGTNDENNLAEIVITDGNQNCFESIQTNININVNLFTSNEKQCAVKANALKWNRSENYTSFGKFDLIVVSDW